jgi:hypothetical protein
VIDEPTPPADPQPLSAPTNRASSAGAVASAGAAGGTMIGDHFGNGYAFPDGSSLSLQGGIRRMKIAENVSPIPQDRFFFSFNHFDRSVFSADPGIPLIDLQRYTVGVEKTFYSGLGSLEIRAPMVDGLDADQISGVPGNEGFEFGDLTITPKVLLAGNRTTRLSAGMGIQVPTADDSTWTGVDGGLATSLVVENTAVHLKPFLGLMHTPNSRAFMIAYAQLDVDVSGYDITSTNALGTLSDDFNDPLFLYLDIQYGYWIYQNCNCCSGGVTGVAPVIELHYATNLEDFDDPLGPGVAIDPTADTVHILNLTGGLKFRLGCNTMLTVAAAVPLRDEDNRQFDWEMISQLQYGF